MIVEEEVIEFVTNTDYMYQPDGSLHAREDLFVFINGHNDHSSLSEWEKIWS